MIISIFQWLALLFTATAIIPAGAHLAELLNKMALDKADYFVVQRIYDGWALFGIVLFGAIFSLLGYTISLIRHSQPYGFAAAALLLVLANLGIFFMWTFPMNKATDNWTVSPDNWETLRSQWEYSHAANALVIFAAFICLLIAVTRHLSFRG